MLDLSAQNGWAIGFAHLDSTSLEPMSMTGGFGSNSGTAGGNGAGNHNQGHLSADDMMDGFTLVDIVNQAPVAFDFRTRSIRLSPPPAEAGSRVIDDEPFELIDFVPKLEQGIEGLTMLSAGSHHEGQAAATPTSGVPVGLAGMSAAPALQAAPMHVAAAAPIVPLELGVAGGSSRKRKRKRSSSKPTTPQSVDATRARVRAAASQVPGVTFVPDEMPELDVALASSTSLANVRICTSDLSKKDADKLRKKKHNDVEKQRRVRERIVMSKLTDLVRPFLGLNPTAKPIKLDVLEGAADFIEQLLCELPPAKRAHLLQ
ncbi:uncharacterized protein AMSG_07380 [Thecamonas trahens ATCC 50062]|uniref:BHLH domain-containing protein n=1 Tax=Thecamonas trahens ATCC 50062 TaxID=461836 RepID=A0A0L0DGA7_THETB|nr:hypothetical protein AMSG_07380 [Thecamonas trahens ATCC 50062]KNC51364.1 hypothetical protein AMSG_07380 [Thecamonas trahens ATCC 50062]|eukprot:XP_013756282.1 hypothetical protein AMSG_07380 [Thecamonas trahens ATCC 50062]